MRISKVLLLLFALAPVLPTFAHGQEYSANIDLFGSTAFNNNDKSSGAWGLSAYGDWRPVKPIAFGLGLGYMNLGGLDISATWIDLAGRLYPFKPLKFGEIYIQGGFGYNPENNQDKGYAGRFHATASAGLRYALKGNRALDLGLVYDVFSPHASPLNAIGLKAGIAWTFGKSFRSPEPKAKTKVLAAPPAAPSTTTDSKPSKTPTAVAAATQATPGPSIPIPPTHTWVEGDNLRVLAKVYYGDSTLYPILVDANTDKVRRPNQLVAGVVLTIPRTITSAMKAAARVKGRQDGYKLWGKWGLKK